VSTVTLGANGRPVTLPVAEHGIPGELKPREIWVGWRHAQREGKWTKQPLDVHTGGLASSTDPRTWGSYTDALRAVRAGRADGVAIALGTPGPNSAVIVGIDMDNVCDPVSRGMNYEAARIVAAIASYAELSPSGRGVHVLLYADALPPGWRKVGPPRFPFTLEVYSFARFFATTGRRLFGAPEHVMLRRAEILALHARVAALLPPPPPTVPAPAVPLTLSDEDVLDRARSAANGAKFARLYDDPPREGDDDSVLDLALCSVLAFWTRDPAQIDRLVRSSARSREKWSSRRGQSTYGRQTIERALAMNTETYTPAYAATRGTQGPERPASPIVSVNSPAPPVAREQPVLVRLADVAPESVTWLWPRRIPRGKLTILLGDPGLGKSQLTLDVAARVTTGAAWPDGGLAPMGDVVVLTAEDGLADTVRPRVDALRGDAARIVALRAIRTEDEERPVSLDVDLPHLEAAIAQTGASLVIIDPVSAYLGKVDSHRDAEVRRVLAPLAALAERTGVAIVAVMHLTKNTATRALYRAPGSIAFIGAPRCVLAVGQDPDTAERRLLVAVKANVSAFPAPLAFSIPESTGIIEWEPDPVPGVDAETVLAGPPAPDERTAREEAEAFLRELLAEGRVIHAEVKRRAREHGISERTLYRAKKRLRVETDREGGFSDRSEVFWRLPSSPKIANTPLDGQPSTSGSAGSLGGIWQSWGPAPIDGDHPAEGAGSVSPPEDSAPRNTGPAEAAPSHGAWLQWDLTDSAESPLTLATNPLRDVSAEKPGDARAQAAGDPPGPPVPALEEFRP
jgi:hypothetical protein